MIKNVQESGCGIIITHCFENLDIKSFFENKLNELVKHKVNPENICFDPGIGFGKSRSQDAYIINNISKIKLPNFPILIGLSRKRIIAQSSGCEKQDLNALMAGTLSANVVAIMGGANIIRVHDVKEAVYSAKTIDYLLKENGIVRV